MAPSRTAPRSVQANQNVSSVHLDVSGIRHQVNLWGLEQIGAVLCLHRYRSRSGLMIDDIRGPLRNAGQVGIGGMLRQPLICRRLVSDDCYLRIPADDRGRN
jgi:hypothetical protein